MFYPEFGFENPTMGWPSPYNYTHSAISSWVGEEMRTIGGEFKVTRPGRFHGGSPHTFSLVGWVFKGNDTTGTILAWRAGVCMTSRPKSMKASFLLDTRRLA
jgi:hypothetical protein